MLEIENLSVRYPRSDIYRLRRVTLSVDPGESLVIAGPSGAGKTTLLKVIAGIISATEGSVFFEGRDISLVHPADRNIGYVPQTGALFPYLTVAGNIAFPLVNRKTEASNLRVKEVMNVLGIEGLSSEYPADLSGGQRQRVSIARAMVKKPKLLLFDEPLANLDIILRRKALQEFSKLFSDLGSVLVYVTHDINEAIALGHDTAVLIDGKIAQVGSISELRSNPASDIVAGLVR